MQCDEAVVQTPHSKPHTLVPATSAAATVPDLPLVDFGALTAQLPGLTNLESIHVSFQHQHVFPV